MQAHLRTDMFQGFHLEMCWTQPGFYGVKGMLNGTSPNTHAVAHPIHPILFWSTDTGHLQLRQLVLDGTVLELRL